MDDWDLRLPPDRPKGGFDWLSLISVIVGWQVASIVGAALVGTGMAIVHSQDSSGAAVLAMFASLFTWPALLLRGVMRFEWGLTAAVAVGALLSCFLMLITEGLWNGGDFPDHILQTIMVYCISGAGAGTSWYLMEKLIRGI